MSGNHPSTNSNGNNSLLSGDRRKTGSGPVKAIPLDGKGNPVQDGSRPGSSQSNRGDNSVTSTNRNAQQQNGGSRPSSSGSHLRPPSTSGTKGRPPMIKKTDPLRLSAIAQKNLLAEDGQTYLAMFFLAGCNLR